MGSRSSFRVDSLEIDDSAASALRVDAVGEQALVARIRAGDQGAFEQLFSAYYEPLRTFLIWFVRAPDVAEELVQDVFFRVWQNRGSWEVRSSLKSYLYRSARNAAAVYSRHARVTERWARAVGHGHAPTGMSAGAGPTDGAAEASDLARGLRRALDRLPERCRQTVILRRQHHLSFAEIADAMGVTVKCAEAQFTKGMKTLRKELAEHL